MDRRSFLKLSAACCLLPQVAHSATTGGLEHHDLSLPTESGSPRGYRLLVPRRLASGEKVPLLILFHGLAETRDEQLGIRAWSDLYGLREAYTRLESAPLSAFESEGPRYLSMDRLTARNQALEERPFQGLAIACPYMPHPKRSGVTLEHYASWVHRTLIPAVQERAPVIAEPGSTGIGGVSLGGYVALEVFSRCPEAFGGLGCVQTAIVEQQVDYYSQRVVEAQSRTALKGVLVLTSKDDPYRRANEALDRSLRNRGVAGRLEVPPGPHNQAWLREVGSVELLFWQDRLLREG